MPLSTMAAWIKGKVEATLKLIEADQETRTTQRQELLKKVKKSLGKIWRKR
jgi:hypothetical protein